MKTKHKNFYSGVIWKNNLRVIAQRVRRVCEKLEKEYGKPRHGNPLNPTDDLIYIIISNRTGYKVANKIYSILKNHYTDWDKLIFQGSLTLENLLKPAGLSKIKSLQIISLLNLLKNQFGNFELDELKDWTKENAEKFLTTLPGVSLKVAKCVMMYTLNFDVLPVDVHVHRIAHRLGWTGKKRPDQCHYELELLIPRSKRYAFHVDCISHGRSVCVSKAPKCHLCCIQKYCRYYEIVAKIK